MDLFSVTSQIFVKKLTVESETLSQQFFAFAKYLATMDVLV